MAWASRADVERWFTYHAPDMGQVAHIRAIREGCKALAFAILDHTPPGADQFAALRLLRETMMTATAGIVCAKREPAPGPNSYLGDGDVKPAVDLNWTGQKYTWKCPACDAVNYGRYIGTLPPAVREVICERCTGVFRER